MTDLLPLRVRSSVPRQHQSTRVRLSPHPRLFSAFLFCPPHHHLLLLATPHPLHRHPTTPSRRRPFLSHRPPTLIRSAATTFISVFAKSPVIVSPSRASRTNGHGTKVRGSPPGLSSWPPDSAKRKSDERTRSGSESDKMPPLGRVFDIILPHGEL